MIAIAHYRLYLLLIAASFKEFIDTHKGSQIMLLLKLVFHTKSVTKFKSYSKGERTKFV